MTGAGTSTGGGRAIFVGGTDTGCGKTTVGAALARAAHSKGWRVHILKPIETGCSSDGQTQQAADARALADAAHDTRELDALCPERLELAAAPAVAAHARGRRIDVAAIERAYTASHEDADCVLVEGAGGLCVPVDAGLDMLDLCKRLGLPLLLVVRARLGTINHTQLSLSEAQRRRVTVRGIVISHTEAELPAADAENLEWLRANCPVPVLGELPYVHPPGSPSADGIALGQIWPGCASGVDQGRS